MPKVHVKSSAAARLKRGGMWVFSNEVREQLTSFARGQTVELVGPGGQELGVACMEPNSLIAARRMAPPGTDLDRSYFLSRFRRAIAERTRLVGGDVYRMVFSEADLLPGLIVDRYGGVLALQLLTWGMESLKEEVVGALKDALDPEAIVFCNESDARRDAGLSTENAHLAVKEGIDLTRHLVDIEGLTIRVDFLTSQKTGLFLDQRASYRTVGAVDFSGLRGFDLFCYSGIFGMIALRRGAKHLVFVDSSEPALDMLRDNLERNGFPPPLYEVRRSDVMQFLPSVPERSADFAFVDPPKFIKSRKHYYQGLQGYFLLNREVVRTLRDGGLLFTFSCSHHASPEVFRKKVVDAIEKNGRAASELCTFRQNVDHPVPIASEESLYLKGHLFKIDGEYGGTS